jgi:hypothetical protein
VLVGIISRFLGRLHRSEQDALEEAAKRVRRHEALVQDVLPDLRSRLAGAECPSGQQHGCLTGSRPTGRVEADQEGAGGQQPEAVEAFAGRGLVGHSGVRAQDHPARLASKLPAVAPEGLQ